jgi:DNA-directed RNA polymerase subunit omega
MTSNLVEEATKIVPSAQVLINMVSKRVRQLTAGHRPMIQAGPRMGFSDIALTEIIEGKLKFEPADSANGVPSLK